MGRHYTGSIITGPGMKQGEQNEAWESILEKGDQALRDGTREPYDDSVPLSQRLPTNVKSKRWVDGST